MVLTFFKEAYKILKDDRRAVLMVVTDHSGSSPGRKGFHMLASKNQMTGTIGGGIMEHKLVELSKSLLDHGRFDPFLKHQKHQSEASSNKSGMICSGEQTIAFFYLDSEDLNWIKEIDGRKELLITYNQSGVNLNEEFARDSEFTAGEKPGKWKLTVPVNLQSRVYVIGGGHVGLALCEILSTLDFEIHLLDHRPGLNTFVENPFAHFKKIVRYEEIDRHIPEGNHVYVVIISFGYRTDKVIARRLLGKQFRYIGMMGSVRKIEVLWRELLDEGHPQSDLDKIVAPIGLDIKSETTSEIGISIAAQLILYKNAKEGMRKRYG
ncbi:MAG: XdhC/CoxI family protein [Saprospirales bacterium]|nr:MAG: XdhC/CoxI family protein [Saprospirales bacterium]